MPWRGNFTREAYAGAMIQEYRDAGVPAEVVHPQSFSLKDVRFLAARDPRVRTERHLARRQEVLRGHAYP